MRRLMMLLIMLMFYVPQSHAQEVMACDEYVRLVNQSIILIAQIVQNVDFTDIDELSELYRQITALRNAVNEIVPDSECEALHDAWLDYLASRAGIAKMFIEALEASNALSYELEQLQ